MNKKRILCYFLCVCILTTCTLFSGKNALAADNTKSTAPVVASASDFQYRLVPTNNPQKLAITKYTGTATQVIIPSYINGYPVSVISASTFKGNSNITYVYIPATVTSISGNPFNLCTSLYAIDVDPNNTRLKSIDGVLYTLDNYGSLNTLVSFPAGRGGHFAMPYGVKKIESQAFDHCYNLTSVDMANTVTELESNAFSYCWNLSSLRLSDNLEILGEYSLAYCRALKHLALPFSLRNIQEDAFLGGIDSQNHKFYYYTNGISCVKNTYAYYYLRYIGLPQNTIIDFRTLTDANSNVTVYDAYGVLPVGNVEVVATPVDPTTVAHNVTTRFTEAYCYDVKLYCNGQEFQPNGNIIIKFNSLPEHISPLGAKIYNANNWNSICVNGSPHTRFVGTQVNYTGRFLILANTVYDVPGDLDGDGIVTLFDARAALHAASGTLKLTEAQAAVANVDYSSDGKITMNDALRILQYTSGVIGWF